MSADTKASHNGVLHGLVAFHASLALFVGAGCGARAGTTPFEASCLLAERPELDQMPACPAGTQLQTRCEPDRVERWCAMDDGTRHGPWRRYGIDGQGRIERRAGEFRHGRRQGVWTWRARNGFRSRSEYRNGAKHGKTTYWSTRGFKSEESQYRHGVLHGRRTRWDRHGHVVADLEYEGGEGVRVITEFRWYAPGSAQPRDASAVLRRPPEQQLWNAMRSIRSDVAVCAEQHGVTGTQQVWVVVYPTGEVSWIRLETAVEQFRGCASKAIKSLEFAQSPDGFSFSYTYVFRPEAAAHSAVVK